MVSSLLSTMLVATLLSVGSATPVGAQQTTVTDTPSVSRGDGAELVVEWQAPSGDSSSVTGYQLRYSKDGTTWTEVSGTVTGKLWAIIGGLDNGYEYQVQVRAVTGNGPGAWSLSGRGTPAAEPFTRIEPVVTGLSMPWGLAFAPDGTMIFTERGGRLSVRLTDGTVQTVAADLSDLLADWETGLMGLVVDPGFATNRHFYTCQGHRDPDADINTLEEASIQVIKWSMSNDYTAATRVEDPLVGSVAIRIGSQWQHAGCRLRFGPQGHLWITTGDGFSTLIDPQSLTNLNGKVLRVHKDTGEGVPGNPFYDSDNADTRRIYTYGHRNPQGLARRPGTDQMWSVEHGTNIDDEINLLVAGGNYGYAPLGHEVCGDIDPYPAEAYCIDAPMTDLDRFPGAVAARWSSGDPTLATSGGVFLEGEHWGAWEGRMAVATLAKRSIWLFNFTPAGEFVSQYREPESNHIYSRLRTPIMGPDGALYVTTSDNRSDASFQHNDQGIDEILRFYVYDPQVDAALGAMYLIGSDGSSVELSPEFTEGILRYSAEVARDVTSVTVAPYPVWAWGATVTVNGGDPSAAVALEPGLNTVSVAVTAEDGVTTRTYTVEVTRDDRSPGVVVSPESVNVTEEAPSATYTVRLRTRPDSPVRIHAVSANGHKVRVTPQVIDVRANDEWDRPRTFSVYGEHDYDGADEEVVITHMLQTSDTDYQSVEVPSVTVSVDDKHTLGVMTDIFAGTVMVGESRKTHRVYLDADPSPIYEKQTNGLFEPVDSHTVTIEATSSDPDVALVIPASVTFTAGAYDPQSFSVYGVSPGTVTITHTISGTDPDYTGTPLVIQNVKVTVPAAQQQAPQQTPEPDGQPAEDSEPVGVPAPGPDDVPVPGPVLDVKLSAAADSLTVRWSAPETGDPPTGYVLRLNEVGRSRGVLKTPKAKKTSVTFRDLEPGKSYKLWVRAKNKAGNGPRTFTVITLPNAPPAGP